MIAIIDYDMGNVKSVYNAIEYIGHDSIITSDAREIDKADRIILPGVGAFGDAMNNLKKRGLVEILNKQVLEKKKPILGICLGLQLMAKSSEEHGIHRGLGWLDAEVVKFRLEKTGLKVPHVGWNNVEVKDPILFKGLAGEQINFYFVHSFHIVCNDKKNITATCRYGIEFTSAIHKENIFATQFHPEKSQDSGLKVLENFINY